MTSEVLHRMLDAALFVAVLVSLTIGWLRPLLCDRFFSRVERWGNRLAERSTASILGVCALLVLIRLLVWPLDGLPVPRVQDEFCYLLASDTFVSGRLTNPPHPMWVYLETMHVNQFPTYMAKYPPAQGAVLALGQLLGHPWIGVLLSVTVLCGLIAWMLRQWLPRRWALLGGFLAVAQFGAGNYWIDTYWGGAVAAIGGCLVFGAFPRILRRQRAMDALLFGLGVAILANSRPYEGFLFSLAVTMTLTVAFFRKDALFKSLHAHERGLQEKGVATHRADWRIFLSRVVFPACCVLLPVVAFMGYYNWRGTGNALLSPYVVNDRTYWSSPIFQWQKLRPPHHYLNPQFQNFYSLALHDGIFTRFPWSWSWNDIREQLLEKLIFIQRFYVAPDYAVALLAALFLGIRKNGRIYFAFVICGLAIICAWTVSWGLPHYVAPYLAAEYVLIVSGLRLMRRWVYHKRPVGVGLTRALVLFHIVVLLVQTVAFAYVHTTASWSQWGNARARIESQLESTPGEHLVIVRYAVDHSSVQEWVYNRADIDHSKVVWARYIPGRDIQPLLRYFHNREIWQVEADTPPRKLVPYSEDAGTTVAPSK